MNEQRRELTKTIYNALKNGEISRGNQLLPERELAIKFNVKRSSLREALIALEALGVIDIRERQGIFIGEGGLENMTQGLDLLSYSSPVDILSQLFEVRSMIETSAAELAAQRRTERDISLLRNELEFFQQLNSSDHPEKSSLGAQHNTILHTLIIGAAHNTVLQRIYEGISKLSQSAFTALGNSSLDFHPYSRWPGILFKEHEELVEAIIQADAPRARSAILLHLENSRTRNQNAIRSAQMLLQKRSNPAGEELQ